MDGRGAAIGGLRGLFKEAPHIALALFALALTLVGVVMVYSASMPSCLADGLPSYHYALRQAGFAFWGGAMAYALYRFVPISTWSRWPSAILWVGCMALMVAVAVQGEDVNGAARWLDLGLIRLQPSELAKIAVVLTTASTCSSWQEGSVAAKAALLRLSIGVGVPLLVMAVLQSDLGSSVVCAVGALSALFFAGVRLRFLAPLAGAGVVAAAALTFLVPYRRRRLEIMLNPWDDGMNGLGDGYQLAQSFQTFAEGGFFGVGLGSSKQKFGYLPECHTDFIFSVIGAELGTPGAFAVILLFLGLLCSGLRIAKSAQSRFGYLSAASLVTMVVFQAFLNMACVMGMFPLTGKPLPLVSYGGSSMLSTMFLLGIALSVWGEKRRNEEKYQRRREDLRIVRAEKPVSRVSLEKRGAHHDGLRKQTASVGHARLEQRDCYYVPTNWNKYH